MKLILISLLFIFKLEHGKTEDLCTVSFTTNNGDDEADPDSWQPFFPELFENGMMNFRVMATDEARIYLSPTRSIETTDYYRIKLGHGASDEDTVIERRDATPSTQQTGTSSSTTSLSAGSFLDLWVSVTGDNMQIIEIGKKGEHAFATLNSDAPFDINWIAAGTDSNTGTWQFCNVLESLSTGATTVQSTCDSSLTAGTCGAAAVDGNTNGNSGAAGSCFFNDEDRAVAEPYWEVDLGKEYHILGVVIHKRTDVPVIAQALGCFIDEDTRALPDNMISDSAMTNTMCIEHCASNSKRYAGSQYAIQCFCGDDGVQYDMYGLANGECTTDCGGNSVEDCGGSFRNTVWDLWGGGDFQDNVIRVGNCAVADDFTGNTQCGPRVSVTEASYQFREEPLFRECPENTYGRYVTISNPVGDNVQFCEVEVYGQEPTDPTSLSFAMASDSVLESDGTVTLAVTRTSGGNYPTCSQFSITTSQSGIAHNSGCLPTSSVDSSDLSIMGSASNIQFSSSKSTTEVILSINEDQEVEGDEDLGLCLSVDSGAVLGSQSTMVLTVTDDDPYHFIQTSPTYTVHETGGKVTITVKRSGYLKRASSVDIATNPSDGMINGNTDFIGIAGETVFFSADDDEETVDITILDDNDYEGDETFTVALSNPSIGEYNMAPVNVVIEDDDPVITFTDLPYTASESGPLSTVTIAKTFSDREVQFELKSTFGSSGTPATPGTDFEIINRVVTFPAGQTTLIVDPIAITDDVIVEGEETLDLILTSSDATVTGSPITVTINDNDAEFSAVDPILQVLESEGEVKVMFMRGGDNSREHVIDVQVYGSTTDDLALATDGVDFLNPGINQVRFAPGSATAELVIPIRNDVLVEHNEIFYVEIIGDIERGLDRTTIYILNDDARYSIQNVDQNVLESVGSFQVLIDRGRLDNIPGYLDNQVSLYLSTNLDEEDEALKDEDFKGILNKEIVFRSGQSVQTCTIDIYDDKIREKEETFKVIISNDNLYIDPSEATVTISDDDGLYSISLEDTEKSVSEDKGSVTFTVTKQGILNSDGEDQSLKRTSFAIVSAVAGTATPGTDFQGFSATLTFPTGVGSVTDTIEIYDDELSEPAETFLIMLTDADGEIDDGNKEVTVTINDNDEEMYALEKPQYTAGESCGELRVTVVRTGGSGQGSTLLISATDGTATYPADYSTTAATVSFAGSEERKSVTFDITDDSADEGSETFTLSLALVSGSGVVSSTEMLATVTIEDQQGVYSFDNDRIEVTESIGTLRLPLTRTGDPCTSSQIDVSTIDGEAKAILDFSSFTGRQVIFDRGSSTSAVEVNIVDDNVYEQDETFILTISGADTPVGTGKITVTIQDNDSEYSFDADEYTGSEAEGSVTLTIQRSGNAIEPGVARIQTVPNRGNAIQTRDYNPFSTEFVEFDASQTSKTFPVSIIDDEDPEDDETFYVAIVSVTDGTIGTPNEAAIVIKDDDGDVGSDNAGGLSTTAIIGLAAGGGGAVLILVVGCITFLMSMGSSSASSVPKPPLTGYPPPTRYAPPSGYRPSASYSYQRPPSYRYQP